MTARIVIPLLVLGLVGCKSTSSATRADGGPKPIGEETVKPFDLNNDGKPDVWTYSVPAQRADGSRTTLMTRKELDINWDGKVDIVRHYDGQGRLAQETMDLDFDGRPDQETFYENGLLLRKERDTDFDGKVDLWLFVEDGKLAREERDTNQDGKADSWEQWQNGRVTRIGKDDDGDGKVDSWVPAPEATPAPAS